MTTCSNCKKQNEDGSLFCGECGNQLTTTTPIIQQTPKAAEPEKKTEIHCRNCGKVLAPDAYACTGCGLPPYKGKNNCQSCGATTNPEAVICISCGVKLLNKSSSNLAIENSATFTDFQSNSNTKQVGFWGAVICFIGFFLPWMDIYIFSGNGFTAATKMLSDFAPARILLLSIPIISGIIIFNILKSNILDSFAFLKVIPIAVLVISTLFIREKFGAITKVLEIGIYMTFIGSILLCFLQTKKK